MRMNNRKNSSQTLWTRPIIFKESLLATKNTVQSQPSNVTVKDPKISKPEAFKDKGSVQSWIGHMSNYVNGETENNALVIVVSYLEGLDQVWWICQSQSPESQLIHTLSSRIDALSVRFEIWNKGKIARHKLKKWRKVKDALTFDNDFQRIVLCISNIALKSKLIATPDDWSPTYGESYAQENIPLLIQQCAMLKELSLHKGESESQWKADKMMHYQETQMALPLWRFEIFASKSLLLLKDKSAWNKKNAFVTVEKDIL